MNQNKIEEMAEEKELRQTRLNLRLSNNGVSTEFGPYRAVRNFVEF